MPILFLLFSCLILTIQSTPELKKELSNLSFKDAVKTAWNHQGLQSIVDTLEKNEMAIAYALKHHDSNSNGKGFDIISDAFYSPHKNRLYRLEKLLENPTLSFLDFKNLAQLMLNAGDVWAIDLLLNNPKIDLSFDDNHLLKTARSNNDSLMVEKLKSDQAVRNKDLLLQTGVEPTIF